MVPVTALPVGLVAAVERYQFGVAGGFLTFEAPSSSNRPRGVCVAELLGHRAEKTSVESGSR